MRSLTVTLRDDLVQAIEAKVAAGEYASESEIIQDGLASLLEVDQDLDAWLRDEVVPGCRNRAADPSTLVPAEEVLDRVQRRFAAKHQ